MPAGKVGLCSACLKRIFELYGLYQRGGFWWCRVRDRRGRIVRKSTRCRDPENAFIEAKNLERESVDQAYAAAAQTTLERAIGDYLKDLIRRESSEATQRIAAQKCGHFIRLWKPDFPLGRVDAKLVEQYIDARLREDVSRFTIKKELGHLRQVLLLATHHGAFHLPLERVFPPFFRGGHKPRTRCPMPQEVRAVLEHLTSGRAAHVAFIVATGARWSESVRAERRDIDLETGMVFVRGTKTRKAASWIPITPLMRPWLEFVLDYAPGSRLLFAPWGKAIRDIRAACDRAGVQGFTPNDLRRAFTTWHLEAGLDKSIVYHLTRHTTDTLIQTTYGQLTPEALAKIVAEKLSAVPALYLPHVETEQTTPCLPSNSSEKAAPPARIELATNGLGIRFRNPRSVGNLKAHERKRDPPPVSVLNDKEAQKKPEEPKPRATGTRRREK